jgi:hypothetical protein
MRRTLIGAIAVGGSLADRPHALYQRFAQLFELHYFRLLLCHNIIKVV